MAYLVVKAGGQTKSYSVKSSANKPYLKVSTGYIPLTTETTTATGLRAKVGGSVCRPIETYTTSVQTTVTTGTSYATRSSTYSTTYGTRKSTSQTGYLTRTSQYQTYSVSTKATTRESWSRFMRGDVTLSISINQDIITSVSETVIVKISNDDTISGGMQLLEIKNRTNTQTLVSFSGYTTGYATNTIVTIGNSEIMPEYALSFPRNYKFKYQYHTMMITDIPTYMFSMSNYRETSLLAEDGMGYLNFLSQTNYRSTYVSAYIYYGSLSNASNYTSSSTVYYNTTRKSTSATTYGTRSSTSQTGYLTRSSTSATVYLTTTQSRETTSQ